MLQLNPAIVSFSTKFYPRWRLITAHRLQLVTLLSAPTRVIIQVEISMLTTRSPWALGACKSNAKKEGKRACSSPTCLQKITRTALTGSWSMSGSIAKHGSKDSTTPRQTPDREQGNSSDFSANLKHNSQALGRGKNPFIFIPFQVKINCYKVVKHTRAHHCAGIYGQQDLSFDLLVDQCRQR